VPLLECDENLYKNFFQLLVEVGKVLFVLYCCCWDTVETQANQYRFFWKDYHFILNVGPEYGLVIVHYSKYLWGKDNTESKANEITY